jgi:phosphoribosylamine-glycine ligase
MHATDGTLDQVELQWDRRVALGVVMAAGGYPMNPHKGDVVGGIPAESPDAVVFHAGTTLQGKELVTLGRPRAVRDGARRLGQAGAAPRLRADRRHPLRRRAIPADIGHRAIKR